MTSDNPSGIPTADHSNGIMPPFKTFDEFINHITVLNISDREILVNMAFQMNKVYHLIGKLMTETPLGAMVGGGLPPGFPLPPGMSARLPG